MGKKKFDARRFRALMKAEIRRRGYHTVEDFIRVNQLPPAALKKALVGMTVPSRDSLNTWCQLLECLPERRREIFVSVYLDAEMRRAS
jgi:hypothetical protein